MTSCAAAEAAAPAPSAILLLARLAAKVDVRGDDECWPWTGACNSKGYPVIRVAGRTELATRARWTAARGPIPAGRQLCHTCDNPPCMNPRHHFLGTAGENARDKVAKGRAVNPLAAANAAKTHCPAGHPYTPENTVRWTSRGDERMCGTCQREQREQRRRRAASGGSALSRRPLSSGKPGFAGFPCGKRTLTPGNAGVKGAERGENGRQECPYFVPGGFALGAGGEGPSHCPYLGGRCVTPTSCRYAGKCKLAERP